MKRPIIEPVIIDGETKWFALKLAGEQVFYGDSFVSFTGLSHSIRTALAPGHKHFYGNQFVDRDKLVGLLIDEGGEGFWPEIFSSDLRWEEVKDGNG